MWSLHTMEYESAIKRNEILIRAIAWLQLRNVMLGHKRLPII